MVKKLKKDMELGKITPYLRNKGEQFPLVNCYKKKKSATGY